MVRFNEGIFCRAPKFDSVAVSYGIKNFSGGLVLALVLERPADPCDAAVSDDDVFGKPSCDAVGRSVAHLESIVNDIVRPMR